MVAIALTRAAALAAGTVVVAGTVAAQPPPSAPPAGDELAVRTQIQALERVLAGAVRRSAGAVEGQVPAGGPGLVLFAGPIQVRGFRLEGYGVFFDVEYPVLRRSIVWSMQRLDPFELSLDIALQMLRRQFPADLPPAGRAGGRAAGGLSGSRSTPLERVAGGAPRPSPDPRYAPSVAGDGAAPATGRVVVDPLRVYRQALQVSLTDALVLGGAALGALLPEDALLTVGARDATGLDGRDGRLRVAARDLVAFREGGMTLEEARERVEAFGF
ncbi:MAG: hypothetical protein OXH04_07300 [Acidobacteria bacterium]|nr:hypothetical protein [Acidobacteriota bacterium]